MLMVGENNINDINVNSVEKLKYHEADSVEKKTRIAIARELIKIKQHELHLDQFNISEISELLDFVCTS